MEEGKTKTVVRGALFLTMAGLLSKVLSATYRIPLQNLTGDLGFYIYQQIYPLIGIVMMLALYGYPVAVSAIIADRHKSALPVNRREVYAPLLCILFCLNGILAGLLFGFAPQLARWVEDPHLVSTFRLGAGLFLLLPFTALLRGIFQGHFEMKVTAYSQLTEQIIRVLVIITMAIIIYQYNLDIYLVGKVGVIASLLGMGATSILLFLFISRREKQLTAKKRAIPWRYYLRICISLGVIAALSHMILLLMQLVDVLTLVPNLIESGQSLATAKEYKGIFDRGQPLIQFGIVFGSSFALAVVPAVVRRNKEHVESMREALLFSFYLAAPATLGLVLLMPEVNGLLFTDFKGSYSLQILVMAILLSALTITACAILQSLGYVKQIALYIVIACSIKWLLNSLLVPHFQITGSAIATVSSLFFLMLAVILLLHKKVPKLQLLKHIRWKAFLLASGCMAIFLIGIKIWIPTMMMSRLELLFFVTVMVMLGAAIYIACLLRYRVFSDKQLQAFPYANGLIGLSKMIAIKKEDENEEEN